MHEEDFNWELIVHRLDSIAEYQKNSSKQLSDIMVSLNDLKTVKDNVNELKVWKTHLEETVSLNELTKIKNWKSNIDEVVSPTQLKEKLKDVSLLKTFKTQALMVWVVVQAVMVGLVFLNSYLIN